jgi:hypothetical protein
VFDSIAGKFDVPIPQNGLDGVILRGVADGACSEPGGFNHEAIFYAGSRYGSSGHIVLPVERNISCGKASTIDVRVVDMLALGAGTCRPPPLPGIAFAANARPLAIGRRPRMSFDGGTEGAVPAADGTVTLRTYSEALAGACMGAGFEGVQMGGQCANPGALPACGVAGEVEIAALDPQLFFLSQESDLVDEHGIGVVGIALEVVDGVRRPIAGATISLGGQRGAVRIVTPGEARLEPSSATATNASGMFTVYIPGDPTTITVSSPNHRAQTFTVTSTPDLPITLIAVLPRR